MGTLRSILVAMRHWLDETALGSDPGNWSPNGGPQNGDFLTFPDDGNPFPVRSMNNDQVNLNLNPIIFAGGRRFNSLDVGRLEVSGTNIDQTNPWELTAVARGRAPFEAGLARWSDWRAALSTAGPPTRTNGW